MEAAARRACEDARVGRALLDAVDTRRRRDQRLPRLRRHRTHAGRPPRHPPRTHHPHHLGREHPAVAPLAPVRRDRRGPDRGGAARGRRGVPDDARARQGRRAEPVDPALRGRGAALGRYAAGRDRDRIAPRRARGLRELRAVRECLPRRARPVARRAARRAGRVRRALRAHRRRESARLVPRREGRGDPHDGDAVEPDGRVPLPQVPERHHGGEPGRGAGARQRGGGPPSRRARGSLGVAVGGRRRRRAVVPLRSRELPRAAGHAARRRRAAGDTSISTCRASGISTCTAASRSRRGCPPPCSGSTPAPSDRSP